MNRILSLLKAHKILVVLAVGAAAIGVFVASRGGANVKATVAVTRGAIVQEVSVTGRVKPAESVDLAFLNSGKVSSVRVRIGDAVTAGQILATLDTAELAAQLRQAQAAVAAQQAKLDELVQGTRPEDLAIKESELRKAEQDLSNEYDAAFDVLSDAYTKADNAARLQTQSIYIAEGTDLSPLYRLSFSCSCTTVAQDALKMRVTVEQGLLRWRQELDALAGAQSPDALSRALANARGYVTSVKMLLDRTGDILDSNQTTLDATTLATYRTSISTGRASVDTALSAINTQDQTISSQKLVVERIQNELALKKAGSTPEQLAAQRAQVESARAQVQQVEAQISKSTIRAPMKGIVTKQDFKVGEIVAANTARLSVISDQNLEIEANIPEVDIGKVRVGNSVAFTADALPGESFTGTVTSIDPAETVIDGVVSFRVVIAVGGAPERGALLRSGMTVNLEIETARRESALMLPQYTLSENETGVFVRKLVNGTPVDTPVTLGIQSKDGMTEILSGVTEGDLVENIGLK